MNARPLAIRLPAVLALGVLVERILNPIVYAKDVQADYLPALAWRLGLDPYTRLDELAHRFFPVVPLTIPHPTPHPPIMLALYLPLTYLPYPLVAALWLGLSLGAWAIVTRRLGISPSFALLLVLWPPLLGALYLGQWEPLILAGLLLAWRLADRGDDWRAGLLLGLLAALKLYPALFLVPFLWQMRLRVVAGSAVAFLAAQVVGLAALGPSAFLHYWTEILPAVSLYYQTDPLNTSPLSWLLRATPDLAYPLWGLLAVVVVYALRRSPREAAAASICVLWPSVWWWYPLFSLPLLMRLWRASERGLMVRLAAVLCSSFGLLGPFSTLGPILLLGLSYPTMTAKLRPVAAAE